MEHSIQDQPFFCSWSGGKDSCLALYHAIQRGGRPGYILNMLDESGLRSRSHGLPRRLIEEQAQRLGIPAMFRSAMWTEYEKEFTSALLELRERGIRFGVFGDIDMEEHREWVERVCGTVGVHPLLPLWKRDRHELLEEFIRLGFKARIVVLHADKLDKRFLGRSIDKDTLGDLEKAGIDPSGELGEYHTVVTAGPIFSSEVRIKTAGEVFHDGCWFLESGLPPCPGGHNK